MLHRSLPNRNKNYILAHAAKTLAMIMIELRITFEKFDRVGLEREARHSTHYKTSSIHMSLIA